MNKYTKLSDFEINKKVAEKIGLHIGDFYKQVSPDDYNNSEIYVSVNKNDYHNDSFDPCNNPSDAMPIIIENDIAIFPARKLGIENWCAESDFYDIGEKEVIWGMESNNKNPLRAAMELFLLMKDAENEG